MSLAAYEKYESYKDSGIEFIGNVPANWSVEPGRQCVRENRDKNTGMKESVVLSLSYGKVIVKDEDKLTGLVPESFETYQIVQQGDIIIRGMDLQNDVTSLRTGKANDRGIISSAYINLRPLAGVDSAFLHYLLHSYDEKKVFYSLGSGLRQNLSYLDFKYLRLPVPAPNEQRAIADFLDCKCEKINEAVRIKEAQIAFLRERRQILIQEAVTRGLNPDAPMKDSGIDWIGQIPAHWEVKRLKNLVKTWTGYAFSSSEFITEGIPVIRIGDLIALGDVTTKKSVRLPENYNKFLLGFGVKFGDILMAMTGGTIGKVSVYSDKTSALLNQRVCAFRPNEGTLPELVLYWMQTSHWSKHITLNADGGAQPNISDKATIEMKMVIPFEPDEQRIIVDYIKTNAGKIDAAITLKQDQISALKEYKTSLINAAVTGKIKVV